MSCPIDNLLSVYRVQVDRFSYTKHNPRYAFVTHAHSDHTQGLNKVPDKHLYATRLTLELLGRPHDDTRALSYFQWTTLEPGFLVYCLPAFHCDGSCMLWFFFEQEQQHILYTGDFRWNLVMNDWFRDVHFSAVYYDDTFLAFHQPLPSLDESLRDLSVWIKEHPQGGFIHAGVLGIEQLLTQLPITFRLHPVFTPTSRRGRELRILLRNRLDDTSPFVLHHVRKRADHEYGSPSLPWIIPTCLPILRGDSLSKTVDPDRHETTLFFCTHSNRVEISKLLLSVKSDQTVACGHQVSTTPWKGTYA
jgi:hypothetical protein